MKTAWDTYLDQQIADPTVRQAFEEETKVLNRRRRQSLTKEIKLVTQVLRELQISPGLHR